MNSSSLSEYNILKPKSLDGNKLCLDYKKNSRSIYTINLFFDDGLPARFSLDDSSCIHEVRLVAFGAFIRLTNWIETQTCHGKWSIQYWYHKIDFSESFVRFLFEDQIDATLFKLFHQ